MSSCPTLCVCWTFVCLTQCVGPGPACIVSDAGHGVSACGYGPTDDDFRRILGKDAKKVVALSLYDANSTCIFSCVSITLPEINTKNPA
jgi:hypothetical protein